MTIDESFSLFSPMYYLFGNLFMSNYWRNSSNGIFISLLASALYCRIFSKYSSCSSSYYHHLCNFMSIHWRSLFLYSRKKIRNEFFWKDEKVDSDFWFCFWKSKKLNNKKSLYRNVPCEILWRIEGIYSVYVMNFKSKIFQVFSV